jgi:hypothetical protein
VPVKPPQIPTPLSPLQAVLRIAGIIAVGVSIWIAFGDPFGLTHWLWLAGAGLLLWAARRSR